MKPVTYRCPDHGPYYASYIVYQGNPAPETSPCPECSIHGIKKRRTHRERGFRSILVSNETHARLIAHARANNISIADIIASMVESL